MSIATTCSTTSQNAHRRLRSPKPALIYSRSKA